MEDGGREGEVGVHPYSGPRNCPTGGKRIQVTEAEYNLCDVDFVIIFFWF